MTALGDPDPRVRQMAARLLADAPGDDTLDALLAALDDPEPAVRASSAEALIGKDAVHPDHIERAEAEIDRLLVSGPRGRAPHSMPSKDSAADPRTLLCSICCATTTPPCGPPRSRRST